MNGKGLYLSLLILLTFPAVLSADIVRVFSYADMTPAAKQAVDKFIQDYGRTVEKKLASLDEAEARTIAGRLKGSMMEEYMHDYKGAYNTDKEIYQEYPNSTLLLTQMAAISYNRARVRDGDWLHSYEESIGYSEKCLKIDPENGACWFLYGAALGEYSVNVGIFKTVRHIKEVHDAFEKAARYTGKDPLPFGPEGLNSKIAAYMGLTQFYRLCPDWWIMKLIAGIRGNKKKAYEYSKEIPPLDFDRANTRALAALCYGAAEKNEAIVREGIAIVHEAAKQDVVNPVNYYVSRQVHMLDRLFTTRKNLTMADYYKIGCSNIQRPEDL